MTRDPDQGTHDRGTRDPGPDLFRSHVRRAAAAATTAGAPAEGNRHIVSGRLGMCNLRGVALGLQIAPVRDDIRTTTVNLQPGQRLFDHRAVQQSSLRSMGSLDVQQARLQGENLVQPLDIAARNRQHPELDAAFERIRGETRPATRETEGVQQRTGEDRVRQRIRG